MRIERLTIENFRGIRGTYEFEPEGDNAVIVGPNGSGKSSILEAVDFLLTDSVTQLSGEGMGVVKQHDVIPNVDAEGACRVTGCFRDPETGDTVEITRDYDSRELQPPEDALPETLQQLIDTAKQGQHILTRSDLLDLIVARPKTRREVLSELLDLPEIDERRLTLQRTRRQLEDRKKDAKTSVKTVENRLRDLIDSKTEQPNLEQAALESINELRGEFDAPPVDSIDSDTVREDIKSPVSRVATEALQREQPRKELIAFSDWIDELNSTTQSQLQNFSEQLTEFRERSRNEFNGEQLELLELGEELIDSGDDTCPLCQQTWDRERPLLEDVRQRKEELEDLRELRHGLNECRETIRDFLGEGRESLEYLVKELDPDTYSEVSHLDTFLTDLDSCISSFTEDILYTEDIWVSELSLIDYDSGSVSFETSNLETAVESLRNNAESVDELSNVETKYERIQSIADQWADYQSKRQRLSAVTDLLEEIEKAERSFISARQDVVGGIYDDISTQIQNYYGKIHPDESETTTSFEITETGTQLQKQFYDAGEYPPHAIHSEGHLDTLGVCLHLALADYLQQDHGSLFLLDDIVMSVDQDHRRQIAELLADEFSEKYQVILTTHDELWAEQLHSQGVLQGGPQVWLREWTLEGGITESRRRIDVQQQWETVKEAMDEDQMQRAAHELRYATERMLQQTCIGIGAKIEYDPRQRYTLKDFKDAVSGRLGELTGRAKDNLNPHEESDQEDYQQAEDLDDKYGQTLHDVGHKLSRVNRRVHWTPGKWLTLSPDEFQEVFEAHKAAYELLYCDECGSSIRYEKFDGDYHELRCNCRSHYDITWD